jgi:hypothetical protein
MNMKSKSGFGLVLLSLICCILILNPLKSYAQVGADGKYLVQSIQLSFPLIKDFPKAILSVQFGLEWYDDNENIALGRGVGIILSGTYAKTETRTVGTIGGGFYARSRVGYKIDKTMNPESDVKYIMSTPELSFIYLFGSNANYALLEFATDFGFGYYLKEENYMFSGDLLRVGVRPGADDKLFFATFYPRVAVSTQEEETVTEETTTPE